MFSRKNLPHFLNPRFFNAITVTVPALALLAALLALMVHAPVQADEGFAPTGGQFPLIVGTSLNAIGTNHDVFEIDVVGNTSQSLLPAFPVWGATYDAANDRVLFTSSSGSTNGDQLWEWPVGGALNNLGTIMDATAGGAQRMDGLAISGGVLYGSYAGNTAEDGIWTINTTTLAATLVYPFSDSVSGIDADPNTGIIYGVNDTTASLVEIDPGGNTMTPVTAYPVGALADIDGLAVSNDGRAYLITDEPGSLYVYNLNTNSYESNLTAPWTSADTFSGGAYIGAGAPPQPGIVMTKTVNTDPNTCGTTNDLTVPAGGGGTLVGYCYTVMNTGDVTLTMHDLVDSELGPLFTGFPYNLGPGQSVDTVSAGMTISTVITQTTMNLATWTAYVDTAVFVTATATATVTQAPPTSVSLTGVSGDVVGVNPLAFGLLLLVLAGIGAVLYRRRFVE
jgi:hypothetical protein